MLGAQAGQAHVGVSGSWLRVACKAAVAACCASRPKSLQPCSRLLAQHQRSQLLQSATATATAMATAEPQQLVRQACACIPRVLRTLETLALFGLDWPRLLDPAGPAGQSIAPHPGGARQTMARCRALTRDGEGPQCSRQAAAGSQVCGQHLKMGKRAVLAGPGPGPGPAPASRPVAVSVRPGSASADGSGSHQQCQARINGGKGDQCSKAAKPGEQLCNVHLKMGDRVVLVSKGATCTNACGCAGCISPRAVHASNMTQSRRCRRPARAHQQGQQRRL